MKNKITLEDFKKSPWHDALLESVVDMINEGNTKDLGKIFQDAAEKLVNKRLNEEGIRSQKMTCDGYDLLTEKYKRVQVKYRYVNGKTPYSRQLHFETTRRNSKKNEGAASESGHVSYSLDEFDYVAPVIVHGSKGQTPADYLNSLNTAKILLIEVADLKDPEREGCCLNSIPSKVLQKNKSNVLEI
tara:strand:+ start:41 stop:601 length:561 start_codon:yes stop_codon:yes gene_type:complete